MKSNNRIRNVIALGLILLSIVLLIPGLTSPIFELKIGVNTWLFSEEFVNEKKSVIGTIKSLFKNDHNLVGWLVLFFGIVVPTLKALILTVSILMKPGKAKRFLHKFVSIISKWAMADVFAMGTYIAYLGLRGQENVEAHLHTGFYFFVAYVIISTLAAQVAKTDE